MWRWCIPVVLAGIPTSAAAPVTHRYTVNDPSAATAEVAFFGITKRQARFPRVSGTVMIDPADLARIAIDVSLDASQLTASDDLTRNRLRGPAFFDVTRTRTVRFVGGQMRATGPASAVVDGTLTARGVSRPVTLDVQFSRPIAQAGTVSEFRLTGHTRIDRADFGMNSYRLIVGRKVDVVIDITLRRTD